MLESVGNKFTKKKKPTNTHSPLPLPKAIMNKVFTSPDIENAS